jgi:hypothetical protein
MKKIVLSISSVLFLGIFFLTPLRFDILNTSFSSLFFGPSIGFSFAYADAQLGWIADGFGSALLGMWKLVIYDLTQVLAVFSGWFLDFFLKHSITSSSYRTGLIESGWEILRDLVNIVFIFSLMVIAFQKVFGEASSNTNKRLMKTIVVALVINFSLYGTYLVVDSSNILANLFYNRITTEGTAAADPGLEWMAGLFQGDTTHSVSTALMSHINVQRISQIAPDAGASGEQDNWDKFILYTLAGFINILIASIFFSTSLVFLSRTVGIFILAVLSPIAVATLTISGKTENMDYVGFKKWSDQLIGLAFTAPVFLFFIYITVLFASSNGFMSTIFTSVGDDQMLVTILKVALPFAFIGTILLLSKEVTKSLAGKLGNMISGYITKAAAGVAAAGAIVATGGIAGAGAISRGVGAGGKALGYDNTFTRGASSIGKLAQTAKFDLNKIPGFKKQLGGLGAAGDLLGRGMNTSYADADTAVRQGANNLRAFGSNFTSGRTPESVTNWQNNVQASRDSLMQTRIANQRREAQDNLVLADGVMVSDGKGGIQKIGQGESAKNLLEQKRAEQARMSEADKKAEKDRIEKETRQSKLDMELEQKKLQDTKKLLKNATDPTAKSSLEFAIKAHEQRIKKSKKEIEDIESTSVEGTIKQLEKQLDKAASDAQANLLRNDNQTRNRTQDSSMTINESRRQERTNTQAARVTTGQIRPGS